MDNVTHAALGIAAGIWAHRRGGSVSAAAVAALLAAEAPDLDVFLRASDDPPRSLPLAPPLYPQLRLHAGLGTTQCVDHVALLPPPP